MPTIKELKQAARDREAAEEKRRQEEEEYNKQQAITNYANAVAAAKTLLPECLLPYANFPAEPDENWTARNAHAHFDITIPDHSEMRAAYARDWKSQQWEQDTIDHGFWGVKCFSIDRYDRTIYLTEYRPENLWGLKIHFVWYAELGDALLRAEREFKDGHEMTAAVDAQNEQMFKQREEIKAQAEARKAESESQSTPEPTPQRATFAEDLTDALRRYIDSRISYARENETD